MMTVGGRPIALVTALGFRWACFRAGFNRSNAKGFAKGFAIGTALGVAGCTALVG
jgi:hypothetical protein